ncbi:MAG: hypothetical protein KF773_08390 [Deltaproteobacteria bacterium]|nr:hypothetical protein [Deltaproteobacteria bacterium]MCW5806157.1 hypothetical protein [Deltaproteobacteria bacterium]
MALALTGRRAWLAASASIVVAMALAAAVAGRSCRVSQPGPEAAVRDMIQAAVQGDQDTVYEMLAPATRARLELEAKRATDLVGATTRFAPHNLVSLGASEAAPPTDVTVVEEYDNRAVVEVVSPTSRARIDLVRVDGRWLIAMPQYSPD